jgi:hypothetical protein
MCKKKTSRKGGARARRENTFLELLSLSLLSFGSKKIKFYYLEQTEKFFKVHVVELTSAFSKTSTLETHKSKETETQINSKEANSSVAYKTVFIATIFLSPLRPGNFKLRSPLRASYIRLSWKQVYVHTKRKPSLSFNSIFF